MLASHVPRLQWPKIMPLFSRRAWVLIRVTEAEWIHTAAGPTAWFIVDPQLAAVDAYVERLRADVNPLGLVYGQANA